MSIEKVWVGIIPEINGGYGVNVIAKSEDEAMSLLRRNYNKIQRGVYRMQFTYKHLETFDKAMEYFGVEVKEIELGKAYYDGFKE
jgi:hypothetical protein